LKRADGFLLRGLDRCAIKSSPVFGLKLSIRYDMASPSVRVKAAKGFRSFTACTPIASQNCELSYRSKKSFTAFDQGTTLLAVVELSRNFWLVAGIIPGIVRQPSKKFAPDENELLTLVCQWQQRAVKAGRWIRRVVVAFEAGRDGFWLARWLQGAGYRRLRHPRYKCCGITGASSR
jgi:hypothetical protein